MGYKIVGKPLTHDEMIEIATATEPRLYCIIESDQSIEHLHVTDIVVDLKTKQWRFKFREGEWFSDNELIFKTKRGAEMYLKKGKK
jgi:hypothetical protein